MSGQASGGQKLTPNPNVLAPSGLYGDQWGANGGGVVPIGGGATDQTGFAKSIAITPSDGEAAMNYQLGVQPGIYNMLAQLSDGQLSNTFLDQNIPAGNSNQG